MRAVLLLVLMCGGLAMSEAQVTGDDKKEEKKDEKYPERVTYRYWDEQGKKFLPSINDCPAKFVNFKGQDKWRLKSTSIVGPTPSKGSEVTTKDGTWVVEKVEDGEGHHILYAKKKPAEKKD